jgi:hypothetical protein
MTSVWAEALNRLMLTKGYRTQTALVKAARKRGLKLRPNTVSAVLNGGWPARETVETILTVLNVPLWMLFVTDEEYAMFTLASQLHHEHRTPRMIELERQMEQWAKLKETLLAFGQEGPETDVRRTEHRKHPKSA